MLDRLDLLADAVGQQHLRVRQTVVESLSAG
ncbi:hypothetical protein JOF56_008739 [Kibdelosporangium banguiense]|uniref:Uncharacterized protein n=1 Tax=Kibdelosporangium banguiense TaxID=1365924 RepID=A0ABS4TVA3_9PSEU|nr:hypothetical protein [Kibdelosporangium banguiense]